MSERLKNFSLRKTEFRLPPVYDVVFAFKTKNAHKMALDLIKQIQKESGVAWQYDLGLLDDYQGSPNFFLLGVDNINDADLQALEEEMTIMGIRFGYCVTEEFKALPKPKQIVYR